MKFVISSSVLSARLQMMGRVIAAKNTLPILDCFLFETQGNVLKITASDNETTLRTSIELPECDADISFAANAKTIQDAMKEIPEQPLEFFVNEQNHEITVEYHNGKYNFMCQPADEYPLPPALDADVTSINVEPQHLLDAVTRTLIATGEDALRPVMNGIFFDIKEDGLTIVASDGHKLSCNKLLNTKAEKAGAFIVPKKPSTLLRNILNKTEEDVAINFDGRNAEIKTSDFEMTCRLIEGRFPNYASVIPKDNPNTITVNRESMIAVLRRVLIFSSAASPSVKIRLEPSKMILTAQNTDFSMSAEESLICDYAGSPLSIGFKGPFLLDLINNLQGEEIIIRLADASRAGIILPAEQKEGEDVLMLLMPVMLND